MYVKPKKSLGQNFLLDKNIQEKIVSASGLSAGDIVLEIGSGMGDLTEALARTVKQVYALEIDRRLFPALEQRLSAYSNCRLIAEDILNFDIGSFLASGGITARIKAIGNIPYYISSPIIEHLIRYRQALDSAYLTVQKEFGRRVAASNGSKEYGAFSCFVQYYCQPRLLFEIKKGSFRPSPKVDSCFLGLEFRKAPPVEVGDEQEFFRLIRASFNQRRKTLRNSLSGLVAPDLLRLAMDKAGIGKDARPEDLSLEDFAEISNYAMAGKKT